MRTLRNSKGITIMGILMAFIAILVYAVILPFIVDAINDALPYMDTAAATMASLIPLVMVIAIIMSLFSETTPYYYR